MNRQQRVACNARKRIVITYLIIAFGVLCVLCSSLLYYYEGYKNDKLISYTGVILAYIGGSILFLVISAKYLFEKKKLYKKDKVAWIKQNAKKGFVFIINIIVVTAYIIFIGKLSSLRISHILNSEPTKVTIANVTNFEQRQSRGGGYTVAIIKYQANGIEYHEEIGKNVDAYTVGQELLLRYSVKYPEMFCIINR